MKLQLLIERLIKFERRMRRVYMALSERPEFSPEMRSFWTGMTEDERQHLSFLERTAGLLNFVQAAPDVPEAVLAGVETKLAAAEAVVQQPQLTSDEALRQALILEGSEVNSLDEQWFRAFSPRLDELVRAEVPVMEKHVRRLIDAVHAFSADRVLHGEATALWTIYQRQASSGAA